MKFRRQGGNVVDNKGGDLGRRGSSEVGSSPVRRRFAKVTVEAAKERAAAEADEFFVFKPKNLLLVLPPLEESGLSLPWREARIHYPGGENVRNLLGVDDFGDDVPMASVCVKSEQGRPCGWCTQKSVLDGSRSMVDRKVGSCLYPNLRCWANVVDSRNVDAGPRVMRFGKKIRDALLEFITSGDIFCDPDNLIPIRIGKTGEKLKTSYTTSLSRLKSVSFRDEWLDRMWDLNMYVPPVMSDSEIHGAVAAMFPDGQYGQSDAAEPEDDDFDDTSFDVAEDSPNYVNTDGDSPGYVHTDDDIPY